MFKVIKTLEQIESEQLKARNEERIAELKKFLADTDYVVLPDYDVEKPDLIIKRQEWRQEIRELTKES